MNDRPQSETQMTEVTPIVFDDGAAYERLMGSWSQLAGHQFLKWLSPPAHQRWIDIGCGNGAFTELLLETCSPANVYGIDPSEGQLSYARTRLAERNAKFSIGNASPLPSSDASFDAAVMALVIFFVPDPAKAVAEMARVVRQDGSISAYAWDFIGGGFPLEPIQAAMRSVGLSPARPPNFEVSQIAALKSLWADAGIGSIETCEISVQRSFADFDDYWSTCLLGPSIGSALAGMERSRIELMKEATLAKLTIEGDGRIVASAKANAIKGVRRL